MKNVKIAYAAICAALGVIFLSVGYFLQVAVSFWVFLASICVMLSLEAGDVRFATLTHLVITVFSLIFNGFNVIYLIPYISFMGICPIVRYLLENTKLNKILAYFIEQALFILSIMLTTYFGSVFFNLKLDSLLSAAIIIALCVPTFFFYNLGMVNIRIKLRKYLRLEGT